MAAKKITKYGNKYIWGHNTFGNTNTLGFKHSKETKRKMSLSKIGTQYKCKGNTPWLGKKFSKAHKTNLSLSRFKCDPNYPYCDIWKDKEYKDDMRKDYCENKDCSNKADFLINHHIYLDKKRCAPYEIMTLCRSCHTILHNALQQGKKCKVNPKDFIIINRSDHVSYIHKATRKIIRVTKL